MNLNDFTWKNRIILIQTPNLENKNYKDAMKIYNKNISEFEKRYFKLLIQFTKQFNIKLIGFDGEVKEEFKKIETNNLFKLVDSMSMSKYLN